ncbi:MAG: hypothetical protein K2X35_16705 [Bryobacteraceae bacterium]|nr:hypothetical protein [Bryobacteraceae bacterium]
MVRLYCAAWLIAAAGGFSLLHAAPSEPVKKPPSANLTSAIIGNREPIPPVFHEEQTKPAELPEGVALTPPPAGAQHEPAPGPAEPPGTIWLAGVALFLLTVVLVRVVRAGDPEQRTERPRYGRALTS